MHVAVIYITSTMLLIAVAPLPYGYYTLLRLVVTGVLGWAAYISYTRNNYVLPWIFILIALLFNPIIKVHFQKEIWIVIDIAVCVFLLVTKNRIQQLPNESSYKNE